MPDPQVKIRLSAEDAASAKIALVKSNLSGLASQGGIAGGILGGLVAGGMIGLANAATQAIPALIQGTSELALFGAQAERTEASFSALSGQFGISSQTMLTSLQQWTSGTVSNYDLMLSANRAMMLGVSDSADEMGQLMAAAIERGRALGVGAQQAVNDIITGIGRMSPMILDNLGIVGVTQSVEEYARSLGKTADALTDVERKQALVNAVIASGSGNPVIDDTASAFERMDAAAKNLKQALGDLFGPALAAAMQATADGANSLADWLENTDTEQARGKFDALRAEIVALDEQIAALQAQTQDVNLSGIYDEVAAAERELAASGVVLERSTENNVDALMAKRQALLDAAGAAFEDLAATQGLAIQTAQTKDEFSLAASVAWTFKAALDGVGVSALNAGIDMDAFASKIRQSAIAMRDSALSGVFGSLGGIASGLMDNMSQGEALDWLRSQKAEYGAMYDELAAMRDESGALMYTNEEIELILRSNVAETGKWASGLDDVARSTGKVDDGFASIKSKVQSMLQGALSPGVSLMDGILPREDDINENARRLADIANKGIAGQSWMDEFKAEVPGIFDEIANDANPQAAAARIFQEFQAGLRPELIDRDLVKQRIKDAITGENNLSQMADEIAQEIAQEMGISLPEALKATQGVLGTRQGSKDTAEAASSEFSAGLNPTTVADTFSHGFMLAMKEYYGRFYASGAASANEYGTGFLSQFSQSVPLAVVTALATLVTPAVMAAIAAQGSAEGAL